MKKVIKVPVIMQMEALECGAACLSMILAYYGKWVPLEQVRADCGVSRDGSNAKNLLKAARNYGFKAAGYRFEKITDEVTLPCIIHWNFNHFVVLNGFKKGKAVLNDPARGTVEVSLEEFDKAFTGICMQFSPLETFLRDGKPRSVINFAKERLKGTLIPIIFVMATSIITTIIGVINPVFSRVFMDRILTGQNPDWLYPLIILMLVVLAVQVAVSVVNSIFLLKIQGKLAIVANTTFIWHVLRLPMEFFSQRITGDIVSRQSSNQNIANTLIQQVAPLALNFITLVLYLVIMLGYSTTLTVIGLSAALLNIFIASYISKKRINITRIQMRDGGKLIGATMSGIEMIETIKASGAENGYFEKWAGYQASVNTATVKFAKLNQYLGAVPGVIQMISSTGVLMVGVILIMQKEFTVGMLLAFQGFMTSFMVPVSSMINVGQSMQEMRTSMERIEDVMNYKPDVDYESSYNKEALKTEEEYTKLSGSIVMKDVTFGYSKLGDPLIKDFNLTLRPGTKVAFVGSSGCGKSTLSKLISGLYKPWSGEILFDGKPYGDISREVITGSLSVVDQDISIFEDSISNNIKMWDNSIEDFEMILAARDARMHEDIMLRDNGYSHKMLENGKNFSGGQRQRLEIARVLSGDPTIIILDEATSALDSKTESEVVQAITDRGITCIVVAHRLSTIRDCEEIIVMDKGNVVERGTHEELYKKGGLYAQLVSNE
jgi:NHLM bacteriocin system ABC transporter peptidase/ATP-binding protein